MLRPPRKPRRAKHSETNIQDYPIDSRPNASPLQNLSTRGITPNQFANAIFRPSLYYGSPILISRFVSNTWLGAGLPQLSNGCNINRKTRPDKPFNEFGARFHTELLLLVEFNEPQSHRGRGGKRKRELYV
jgi:hypothetical protein